MVDAGFQHELQGHHDQGHVPMPGGPLSGLILRHTDMTLGILKGSLDPKTLRLHLGQLSHARLGRRVTQAVFERTGRLIKRHTGVQGEFTRLAPAEPGIDKNFPVFLSQAYKLKSAADYETGPGSVVPPERATTALATATRFVDCIRSILTETTVS